MVEIKDITVGDLLKISLSDRYGIYSRTSLGPVNFHTSYLIIIVDIIDQNEEYINAIAIYNETQYIIELFKERLTKPIQARYFTLEIKNKDFNNMHHIYTSKFIYDKIERVA